jgi:phosphomannomutase
MPIMKDLNLSMFRAYDIRTDAAPLTDELAARLARAEAVYFRDTLGAPGVLVAHDARSTGPRYLQLAAGEYARAGLRVTVVPGVCSTSMFYYAAMTHPELAAVMFGASHNPANDTGQKILGPGVRPIAEHIGPQGGLDRIKELYIEGASPPKGQGSVTAYDPTEDYITYSMDLAGVTTGSLRGLPLMQDYLNGAAGREMMLAFSRAEAGLTPLHFTADGRFPLGDPIRSRPPSSARGWTRWLRDNSRWACFSTATATASTSTGATAPTCRPVSPTRRYCRRYASVSPERAWASTPTSRATPSR